MLVFTCQRWVYIHEERVYVLCRTIAFIRGATRIPLARSMIVGQGRDWLQFNPPSQELERVYVTVGSNEGDANDNNEIWIEAFTFDTYDKAVELAQLAAAIQLGHDLLNVQIIPPACMQHAQGLWSSRRTLHYTRQKQTRRVERLRLI